MNTLMQLTTGRLHFAALPLLMISLPLLAQPPVFEAQILQSFSAFDARQGVAVDDEHFYVINNVRLTRHDKRSGKAQLQWDGVSATAGPLIHLDSGMIHDGRLYAAHSNYPNWPMTSSIEVWDSENLEHVVSHSFGVKLGSLTWLDYHQGSWWGTFANYDIVHDGMIRPYGETRNTVLVQFDEQFNIRQSWTLPPALLDRMRPMSNSGGSWGGDGLLYLTGHDYPEIYVMQLPESGSQLRWVATVHVPGFNGQGIAWDRSIAGRELWGILRQEQLVYRIAMPDVANSLPSQTADYRRGPGEFNRGH